MSKYVLGADVLIKQLKANANVDDVKKAVKLNTSEMQQKAQRYAPVDTGNLKRSIGFDLTEKNLNGHVGATAEYAPYVNYGTRYMTAQPFLTRAFNEQKQLFVKDLKRLMK